VPRPERLLRWRGYVSARTDTEPGRCCGSDAAYYGCRKYPADCRCRAGHGEPAHLFHTIRVFEHAGAAGHHMEDQVYPKGFHYHEGLEHVIPAEAMVEKIRYAAQGRQDPDFVIVARTDAMRTDGFAEGIRRANFYAEAGADFIMLLPNTIEEAKQTPKEVRCPLNYVNGDGNRLRVAGLLDTGT
jgi:2-methylisocitrate lyase-like PEP mutase family enzyme